MTVVDTSTGEVVDIADEQRATELAARVSAAIAHMNARTGEAIEAMIDAYKERIWIALGYGSWEDLVAAKNWIWKPLTTGERGAVGEYLREHGLSFRAIGKVMGTSDATVRRDLAGATNDAPVLGQDGKRYAPTRPENPTQEATVDPDPSEGDADLIGDGPLGHDEGAEAGEEASDMQAGAGASVSPAPAPDLSAFRDPEADWHAAMAKAIVRVGVVLADFPADAVAENADAELIESLDNLAERFARWHADIAAKRGRPLRAVQGGKS